MVVHADWRAEGTGSILDIRAFVPGPVKGDQVPTSGPLDSSLTEAAGRGLTVDVDTNVSIPYTYVPGLTLSGFLLALGERRIDGGRCPSCSGVYVPPRSRCPECRIGPLEPVGLPDRGSIASYTVVHIPFPGLTMELPFVCAWIRLDGADVPFAHLVGEVDPDDVKVGQRVEAVWVPDRDLAPTWESVSHFRPTGEGQ